MAAMIVPVSHSQRWRTRSRNVSSDFFDHHTSSSFSNDEVDDDHQDEWNEEPSDDEDELYDNLQASPWLVVPQAYVSTLVRHAPLSPRTKQGMVGVGAHPDHSYKKAMEMRRANGLVVVGTRHLAN